MVVDGEDSREGGWTAEGEGRGEGGPAPCWRMAVQQVGRWQSVYTDIVIITAIVTATVTITFVFVHRSFKAKFDKEVSSGLRSQDPGLSPYQAAVRRYCHQLPQQQPL